MQIEAEEIKPPPKEEPEIDWDLFKADVGFKHMILEIDIAVTMRTELLTSDDPTQQLKYERARKWFKRLQPVKFIGTAIYLLMPFVEKPSWCIVAPDIPATG